MFVCFSWPIYNLTSLKVTGNICLLKNAMFLSILTPLFPDTKASIDIKKHPFRLNGHSMFSDAPGEAWPALPTQATRYRTLTAQGKYP